MTENTAATLRRLQIHLLAEVKKILSRTSPIVCTISISRIKCKYKTKFIGYRLSKMMYLEIVHVTNVTNRHPVIELS